MPGKHPLFYVVRNEKHVKLVSTIKKHTMASTVRMSIEGTNNNLIITIPRGIVDMVEVQKFIDFLRYKALVSKSQATDEDLEQLVDEISEGIAARHRQKPTEE
jgi:hypothetical protein